MTIALWGLTLQDQHHTGLRVEEVANSSMGTHTTGSTSHWVEEVDNSSMGTHTTGSTSHWVEEVDNSSAKHQH